MHAYLTELVIFNLLSLNEHSFVLCLEYVMTSPLNILACWKTLLLVHNSCRNICSVQVVMGVAQLYHHLAPRSEVMVVAKALIRLLRSHREVQSVVLNCIASISTLRKVCFFSVYIPKTNLSPERCNQHWSVSRFLNLNVKFCS